jgi:hypothetical protein
MMVFFMVLSPFCGKAFAADKPRLCIPIGNHRAKPRRVVYFF